MGAALLYRLVGGGAFLIAFLSGVTLILMVAGDASYQERSLESIKLSLEVLMGLVAFGNADRLSNKR